ncbi:hypothetical protein C8F04DRAFT_455275 [Mycena alexandri]|uniref:Ubiquitin-like protease family profile domain-containing protein n=1 Tax=Mycena alexandri TaxID=1745969 RepID=A0AAD6TIJ2_9AGAR|nr:hypothetical protein C8F04DRAFT_455275 [Mycena alexandri]
MPSEQEAQDAFNMMLGVFTTLEANNGYLDFQRERLLSEDLKRFLTFQGRGAMANDEVVNMFVAVLNYFPDEPIGDKPLHFGSLFELAPPSRKFKIMTSFFYSKLKELLAAENPRTGSVEKAKEIKDRLCRWLKDVDFDVLRDFLIPVNEPEHIHWILIELDYTSKAILIYDSWPLEGHTQSKTDLEVVQFRYPVPLALAVLATQVISMASLDLLPAVSHEWSIRAVPIPPQDNQVDCGFFMIMVVLHLVHWGQVHHPDCPRPILSISAATMRRTRVILANALLQWIETYNAAEVSHREHRVDQKLPVQDSGSSSSRVISEKKLTVHFNTPVPKSSSSDKSEPVPDEHLSPIELPDALPVPKPELVPNEHISPIAQPVPGLQEDTVDEGGVSENSLTADLSTAPKLSNTATSVSDSPVPSSVDGEDEELNGDPLLLGNASQTS